MPKLRFLATNRYRASTTALTASSAVSALPVGASQNPDRSYIWRSVAGTGVATIDIDLASAVAIDSVAIANVKLVGAGVLELYERGSAGSPGSATLVATLPTQDRDTRAAFAFFASQTKRHWQLKWTNPGAANDYAELGYAFLGAYSEVPTNFRVPVAIDRADPSMGSASVDGQETWARRSKFFAGAWEFVRVSDAMLDQLRLLWDTLGVSGEFFQVADTGLPWTCWYARCSGGLRAELMELAGRYTVTLPWREVR
jgi:hypothetical protein